jgi:hypothetical protein
MVACDSLIGGNTTIALAVGRMRLKTPRPHTLGAVSSGAAADGAREGMAVWLRIWQGCAAGAVGAAAV